jgi:putative transcriptional regulator
MNEQSRHHVDIYNRVRLLRQDRGLSRKEMADALGINHRTLGYVERQDYRISLELAFRISNFFGLPLEAVFAQEPFPTLSEQLAQGVRTVDRKIEDAE